MAEISVFFAVLSFIFLGLAGFVAIDKRRDIAGALIMVVSLAACVISFSMSLHTANCKGYQTESGITLEVCYPE